ncbi:hypothetical protein CL654_00695 [bacterium]|nr:hypothetical protein [bacterium]|tara:strand:- start:3429 stop:4091 length:663 start_codon:yes stop_codon:yes gene_type:complete
MDENFNQNNLNQGGEGKDLSKDSGTLRALIIVVVIALLLGAFYFIGFGGSDTTNEEVQQIQDGEATLSVVTDKKDYSVGEDVIIQILLDTDKEISGVDVVLSYTDEIEILEAGKPTDNALNQTAAAYLQTAQSGFSDFPAARFGEDGDRKTFSFSGITQARQTITGAQVVAELLAKASSPGEVTIDIVFEELGSPRDTNVAFDGRDILTAVESTTISITE